jgi:biopolymer transport protein ExbD
MIIWKTRHQGSTESAEGLTTEQIIEGVQQGQWEPTDEVQGPNEAGWKSLETHPQFAEAIEALDAPFAPPHPDETKLDMNPLIDVSLVLLIFFILTTTYEELRKKIEPPMAQPGETPSIGNAELKKLAIRVTARQEGSQTVIRVEDEVVAESDLQAKFEKLKKDTGRNRLAVDMDKTIPWRTFIAIQDAAYGAKFLETIRLERPAARE